ncbi:putative ABC transporter permease protein YufP [Paenibacillus marchantiophytorum]|uniref:ABC transporter permease protein YufP n=1 Tax=Paenibacillus marchantiophytorum TaxID=1619310 RepID=A0ABQ1EQV7_9BACL|nr:ABC transporter permease [Paenibacillus marchantiophytorum]GFZ82684.1 putative ABC transporter permease protein YufP [Paenibacillus marchantiophytorum]
MPPDKKKYSILIPAISITFGLIFGAIFMLLGGYNPLEGYEALFVGIFGSMYDFGETLRQITPLIFTGLAVAFAFRTGLFNIGVEGQFICGSFAAVVVGIVFDLPWYIHVPLAFLAGCMAGALWAAIPGFLKAKFQVHEVITTMMLNYVALIAANYFIRTKFKALSERTELIHPSASLNFEPLSSLFDSSRIHLGIIIALLFAFIFYFVLWKTVCGYELRAVGSNPFAAQYAGMSVSKNIILSMMISGFIAGAAGAGEVLGVYGYMSMGAALPGYGFTGIAVALLGANLPLGIIFAAVLFGALQYGSQNMQLQAGIPTEIISIVIAVIILFVAANEAIKWMINLTRRRKEEAK